MRLLAGLLLLSATAPHASEGTQHLRYLRSVLLPPDSTGQVCIALPPELFPHMERNGSDLRLVQGGREVPYAMRVATPPRMETVFRPVQNLGTVDGETTFEVDPPAGSYQDVAIDTAEQNFIATATVTGSHGQPDSAPVRLGAFTLFDFSSQRLGRSTVLHLPLANFEHLRFQIRGPLPPGSIGGVRFSQSDAALGSLPFVTVLAGSAVQQTGQQSVLDLQVPPQVPVDRVRFEPAPSAPTAFSRDVTVTWKPVHPRPAQDDEAALQSSQSSGTLQRVHREEDGQQVDVERLTLDPGGEPLDTETQWHIAIANGDDTPLPLAAVELQMRERDLCFSSAAGGAPYVLFYGDSHVAAPAYDYQRLFAPEAHPVRATLGPEVKNAGYEPAADERPFSERHPALLWVGLLLTVAVLGVVALRSARQATPGVK